MKRAIILLQQRIERRIILTFSNLMTPNPLLGAKTYSPKKIGEIKDTAS